MTTKVHYELNNLAERFLMRFYRVPIPGQGWRYWFVAQNDGSPVDPTLEQKLIAKLIEKKIYLPRGRLLPGQPPEEPKADESSKQP